MIRLGASLIVYLALATQASALSCIPPNIARTFNDVHASSDVYVMGLGTLTAKGRIPKYIEGQARHIPAQFRGVLLGQSGQTKTQNLNVTLDAICYASWCGGFPKTDQQILVFLKKTQAGYRLESNPCSGDFKVSPTKKELRILKKCLKNGGCSKAQVKSLDHY